MAARSSSLRDRSPREHQQHLQYRQYSPVASGFDSENLSQESVRPNAIRWSSMDRSYTTTPLELQPLLPGQQQEHRMMVDGDALTLVILDCSPQPTGSGQIDIYETDRSTGKSPGSSGSNNSVRCFNCQNKCHCQTTELIVRQHLCHEPIDGKHLCRHHRYQQSSINNKNNQNIAYVREITSSATGINKNDQPLAITDHSTNIQSDQTYTSGRQQHYQQPRTQINYQQQQRLTIPEQTAPYRSDSTTSQTTTTIDNYWQQQQQRDRSNREFEAQYSSKSQDQQQPYQSNLGLSQDPKRETVQDWGSLIKSSQATDDDDIVDVSRENQSRDRQWQNQQNTTWHLPGENLHQQQYQPSQQQHQHQPVRHQQQHRPQGSDYQTTRQITTHTTIYEEADPRVGESELDIRQSQQNRPLWAAPGTGNQPAQPRNQPPEQHVQHHYYSHERQQPHSDSMPSNESSQQQPEQHRPREPKPGTRIVKRWNWNKAQFVEEEIPERQILRPIPLPPDHTKSQARPADVWHQDLQALNSAISSPTPSRQYDPSWTAHRIPDEQSVQADPLYRDLMFELQRLEEGVAQPAPEPIVEPEISQRPLFGQAMMPTHIEVNEYEGAEFVCRLIPISDPTMTIEWSVNGKPLIESNRYTSEFEFGVARLRIKRCEAEDSGVYQCKATNALGEAVSTGSLRVKAKGNIQYETLHPAGLEKIQQLENPKQVEHEEETVQQQPPKFISHIDDYVEKEEGESVHFECCLAPVDDPDLKTEWFFNGRPLVTGSRFHTIDDFGFVVLDIDWLYPRDTGEYLCRATNKHGTDITRTVLCVKPDKNIVLDSQLENPNVTIDKLRQLEFPDVVEEQEFQEPEKPAHFIQHLKSKDNKQQFNEGDNVHFEAHVGPATDGDLTVEWFHNDKPLISGHRFKPTFDFGYIVLDILYVYPEDSGVYKCVARNAHGTDVSRFEINVAGKPSLVYQSQLPKEMVGGMQKIEEMEAMWNRAPDPEEEEAPVPRSPPEFVLKPIPATAFEGSVARFCCRIVGNPRPRPVWYINGERVVSGSRYKLTYDGMFHLIINKCLLSDAGKIEVHARNLLGECRAATELKVKRKVDDYRGVLKNSPNPWYDEATLRAYRRQRNTDSDDDMDLDELMQNFQEQRLKLQMLTAEQQQSNSPVPNQVIGYMEPGTPDPINLLTSRIQTPLVEPGDLHPVVAEHHSVMAPAPSTVKRALTEKDTVVTTEAIYTVPDSKPADGVASPGAQSRTLSDDPTMKDRITSVQNEQESQSADGSRTPQTPQLTDPNRRVFGLVDSRGKVKTGAIAAASMWPNTDKTQQKSSIQVQQEQDSQRQQEQHEQKVQHQRQQQVQSQSGATVQGKQFQDQQQSEQYVIETQRRVPASPENVSHGREIHSETHKQTQLERRANTEIMREIIEKDTYEQEHSEFERGRSATPTQSQLERSRTSQAKVGQKSISGQQQQQQQQQHQQKVFGLQSKQSQNQSAQSNQQQSSQQQVTIVSEGFMIPPQFTQKVQPCQAFDGDEAKFECSFTGDPKPTISWFRDHKPVKPSNLYTINTDLDAGRSALIIKRVTIGGNALYTVKAENAAGSARSSANLVVEQHPLGPSKASGASSVSTTSTMTTSTSGAGGGVTDIYNSESGSIATGATRESPMSDHKVVRSVRTRKLSPDDMAAMLRASPEGLIAPTFLHAMHDVHARPGELVRLDVRLVGSQPMEVRWLKNGQRIRADSGHKLLLEGDLYTLLILESTSRDQGTYECVASNCIGEARSSTTVQISDRPPSSVSDHVNPSEVVTYGFMQSSSAASASSSQQVGTSMQQASSSSSSGSSRQQQSSSSAKQKSAKASSLTTEPQMTDPHKQPTFGPPKHPHKPLVTHYTTPEVTSQSLAEIPKLNRGLDNQAVPEGKSVTLRCQISAFPAATEVQWYRQDDRPIKPSRYFRIFKDNDETYCLKILETFQEDAGIYRCVARAPNGYVETSALVTVIPSSLR